MDISAVIMAAGSSTRFGRLKQLEPIGPKGEVLLEYTLRDCLEAGVNHFVFVIRKIAEPLFRETFLKKLDAQGVSYAVVFQELNTQWPSNEPLPLKRTKPWGTGHAILAAQTAVSGPFIVLNADDYYGKSAVQALVDWLKNERNAYALVGYQLKNTLSASGSVSRGICRVSAKNTLLGLEEYTQLKKDSVNGAITGLNAAGVLQPFTGKEAVSMNLFGLQLDFFTILSTEFATWASDPKNHETREFFLPTVLSTAFHKERKVIHLINTTEKWCGLTYLEDKPHVQAVLK